MAGSESRARHPERDQMGTHAPLNAGSDAQSPVRCPFCGSEETEPMALFGAHLLFEQYYCRACHTPFERIVDAKG